MLTVSPPLYLSPSFTASMPAAFRQEAGYIVTPAQLTFKIQRHENTIYFSTAITKCMIYELKRLAYIIEKIHKKYAKQKDGMIKVQIS